MVLGRVPSGYSGTGSGYCALIDYSGSRRGYCVLTGYNGTWGGNRAMIGHSSVLGGIPFVTVAFGQEVCSDCIQCP